MTEENKRREYKRKWYLEHRSELLKRFKERYIKSREPYLREIRQWCDTLKERSKKIQPTYREKLALVAGLLIGEGTIALYKQNDAKHGNVRLHPCVIIANTEKEVCDFVKSVLKLGKLKTYSKSKCAPNHKDQYIFRSMSCKDVFKILVTLRPFLFGRKLKLADLLIEYCESRITRVCKGRGYSEREWQIYEEVKKLNRKGKGR